MVELALPANSQVRPGRRWNEPSGSQPQELRIYR